jgi:hypothetical protein
MSTINTQIMERQEELARLRATPSPGATGRFERMLSDIYAQTVELREQMRPTINVEPADVRVEPTVVPPAEVRVTVPDQSAAIAALTEMMGALTQALLEKETVVNVTVSAVPVEVTLVEPEEGPSSKTVSFKRDQNGRIVSATMTED